MRKLAILSTALAALALLALAVAIAPASALAAYEVRQIAPGDNAPAGAALSHALRIEALSTNATGTVSLKIAQRPTYIWGEETTYLYATNITYAGWTNIPVVVVSGTTTNRYNNYVATITNEVVTVTTNTAPAIVATIAPTNTIAAFSLSAGAGALDLSASNVWLRATDTIIREGTADDGPCSLILEY